MKILLLIIPVAIFGLFVVFGNRGIVSNGTTILPTPGITITPSQKPSIFPTRKPTATIAPSPTKAPQRGYIYIEGLSFAAQAPFGDWDDPIQQDGCEEASITTAVYWARGESFTKTQALEIIKKMSSYQIEKYGQARDTSADDTWSRLVKGYFSYDKSEVREIANVSDIVDWLTQGNLVIVPANGQALNNPNFTPPGPDRHMIVIRGYDDKTKEFITNDVGTRQGENYRYKESVLFSAIRDYPTGDHLPIEGGQKKAILVWR